MSMKFTAVAGFRNWASWLTPCGQRALSVVLVLMIWAEMPVLGASVPLPRPRPAAAPQTVPPAPAPTTAPAAAEPAAPEQAAAPTPCRLALTEALAAAPSIAPIRGPGECGGEDLVRLEAVVLAGGQRVALHPAAILRCPMASAVVDWVRTDLTALAKGFGSVPAELDNFDSFECRGRNRVAGAKLSEHGKANALDVRGFTLANGRAVALTDRAEPRELREQVLHSVCARFTTVLGPGSDWYHEDHVHIDLAERRGGYRICEWNVYDPLPAVAPLLPAERPAEAPPRQVAAEGENTDAPVASEEAAPSPPGKSASKRKKPSVR
jgi:hypothetical protein